MSKRISSLLIISLAALVVVQYITINDALDRIKKSQEVIQFYRIHGMNCPDMWDELGLHDEWRNK